MSEFIRKLELKSFLSFGPESKAVDLTPLNVLIGPNASGKSNFIEGIELLHATPTDFSEPIRIGGSAGEWLWKGVWPPEPATISVTLCSKEMMPGLLYRIVFTETRNRLEILDEALEEVTPRRIGEEDIFFYYRYQNGHPVLNVKEKVTDLESLNLKK